MRQSLPEFGTWTLLAVMIAAAFTFAIAVGAGRDRPRWLAAARLGAYGTVGLIGVSILCLAYAFIVHDFRIRYVAHYSDRSMSTPYLLAALWGGQDGSILWWLFLLGAYTAACVAWMRGRFRDLQPYVIATLMVIILFFTVLMTFAANPFATSAAGAQPDGEGLNPLLQNFYMIIHPPTLYIGFVGCAVPFAFAIAALLTGRLDSEWLAGCRKWTLFAWLFLSIGNALGMLWAYEVLGWGGYWAWDPVENASFLPWLTATAFVHSLMIQERRGMLKIWNMFLVLLTFLLTIFGTFLTRSGLIASVHSFAQSSVGTYFLVFMALTIAVSTALVAMRLPALRSEGQIETILSREASFLANNWAFVGIMVFILVATVFPRISEWFHQPSTVGPSFYNAWLPLPGIGLLVLMGVAPLLAWRKTSPELAKRSFVGPVVAGVVVAIAHFALGSRFGCPALVSPDRIYEGLTGRLLQRINTPIPVMITSLCAFNLAVVAQEFIRGTRARRRTVTEPWSATLWNLVAKARHRYGGYLVHVGIALMFLGFAGRSWGIDKEASLKPGQSFEIGSYKLKYLGPRMEMDAAKHMVFADVAVFDQAGHEVGRASPAKFIYRKSSDSPTTEVSIVHTLKNDLYFVLGNVTSETRVATFQIHLNPMVFWIWAGVLGLLLGTMVAMWPEPNPQESRGWVYLRNAGSTELTPPATGPKEASPADRETPRATGLGALVGTQHDVWRLLTLSIPVVTLLGVAAAGIASGFGLAILVLAGGALLTAIALFSGCLRALSGEVPLSLEDALALAGPVASEEQKRAVLQALRDIEQERSVGKISEADYKPLVQRYREEAKRLLRRMDEDLGPLRAKAEAYLAEQAGSIEKAKTPPCCDQCGTLNDADAAFCKKCGHQVTAKTEQVDDAKA